ncbi:N-acetylmuramoyl-L-alanine amidase [Tritonibacter mobilis]|uniref:N-acetylmuramoyl-L-alanine amidase n=1 Tax=Tritonibacter mobilis F1926 TaxID=1265309 RepID=A0A1B1A025_9RHOB|nr:N-acetylmuramoyl-L-alanine amidase [Tritonibacter mobilis]ANP39913.1 N-acetylmuramoyl-L-alanine amidase [Tritonibacter mobilis F1926]KJZ21841.1 N-acetylmuramoyl-L-alanine amidase [Tritonibacter mobilis]
MTFKDGILEGVQYTPATHMGGGISPSLVILHDTASSLSEGSAADYLQDNDAKVSVHFVIELNGKLRQLVPINRRANHAGASSYHGRKGCNNFSIGIELVNPGKMRAAGANGITWFGATVENDQPYTVEIAETPEHGRGMWMHYPEAQLDTLIWLLRLLFAECETLQDIRAHWYVSPGRKVDTNPLFPMEQIRSHILGRDDPAEDEANRVSQPASLNELVITSSNGDTLNMRRWPSFNPNVIAKIPDGTPVPVLRRGTFDGRDWLQVFYAGQEGWIVASYADPVTYALPR